MKCSDDMHRALKNLKLFILYVFCTSVITLFCGLGIWNWVFFISANLMIASFVLLIIMLLPSLIPSKIETCQKGR